jgi:hypothetical protein
MEAVEATKPKSVAKPLEVATLNPDPFGTPSLSMASLQQTFDGDTESPVGINALTVHVPPWPM